MKKRISRNYILINKYYEKANRYIKEGNIEKPEKILYINMPKYLYDISLDILFNMNAEFKNQRLKNLISSVDSSLNKQLIETSENNYDNFNEQF